jgi:hypothetical protein
MGLFRGRSIATLKAPASTGVVSAAFQASGGISGTFVSAPVAQAVANFSAGGSYAPVGAAITPGASEAAASFSGTFIGVAVPVGTVVSAAAQFSAGGSVQFEAAPIQLGTASFSAAGAFSPAAIALVSTDFSAAADGAGNFVVVDANTGYHVSAPFNAAAVFAAQFVGASTAGGVFSSTGQIDGTFVGASTVSVAFQAAGSGVAAFQGVDAAGTIVSASASWAAEGAAQFIGANGAGGQRIWGGRKRPKWMEQLAREDEELVLIMQQIVPIVIARKLGIPIKS